MQNTLSLRWKIVFGLEIPICLITCIYWFFFPGDYFHKLFGKAAPSPLEYILLQQGAIVVFSMYVWFYGRFLLSKHFSLKIFQYFQEGMAIGDVLVLIASFWIYRNFSPQMPTLIAQVGMASLWLVIRIIFLVRIR